MHMQPTHIYTAGNAAAAACAIDVAQLTSSMLCVHVTLVLVGHHRELSEEHEGMLSTAAAEGGLGSLTIHGRGGGSKPIHIHHFAPPARDRARVTVSEPATTTPRACAPCVCAHHHDARQ